MHLREQALDWLRWPNPFEKARAILASPGRDWVIVPTWQVPEPSGVPGRPPKPVLVAPNQLQHRSVGSPEGHKAMVHALAHIEANAINLALDAVWRFAGMPSAFYRDWWQVALEEAHHFELLAAHLNSLGCGYGELPAHDGLWDLAQRTAHDVLCRMALVPRLTEARGLDATPVIRKKLVSVGDLAGARILDVILRDEITHVAAGNRWYHALCTQRGLQPIAHFEALLRELNTPSPRGPFNLNARAAAGFTQDELAWLVAAPAPAHTP